MKAQNCTSNFKFRTVTEICLFLIYLLRGEKAQFPQVNLITSKFLLPCLIHMNLRKYLFCLESEDNSGVGLAGLW